MIRTMIVDDESIMRVTLHSLINWESCGYTIVCDCTSGAQALDYLKTHTVDLIITDMKMPGMTGIELILRLLEGSYMPVTVVLSGYNEFELVREAFKLGAYDYLLKADINEISLRRLLEKLKQSIFTDKSVQQQRNFTANGENKPFTLLNTDYCAAVFTIDDFAKHSARFKDDLHEKLERPMQELVRQIPRLAGRAEIRAMAPNRYEFCYNVRDKMQYESNFTSIVRQIQSVWHDYMNLSVSAGMSKAVKAADINTAFKTCDVLVKLTCLQGNGAACPEWRYEKLAASYLKYAGECDSLISAVCTGEALHCEDEKNAFFSRAESQKDDLGAQLFLVLIARLNEKLIEYGQELPESSTHDFNYENALSLLPTAKEKELWMRNYLRHIQDFFAENHRRKQPDAIKKARLFMQDNYQNPELTLRTVADYVGFNEKYFTTRFTKICGCTFISFLNELRMERAKELLMQTSLRMYEISDYVGYSNVEHFNHTFKKKYGISPSDYRNSGEKADNISRIQT